MEMILIAVMAICLFVMAGEHKKLEKQTEFLTLAVVALLPESERASDPDRGFEAIARRVEGIFGNGK